MSFIRAGEDAAPVSEVSVSSRSEPKSTLEASVKNEIEALFGSLEIQPEMKEKNLRQLRHRLQETFAGQEDCWSCEGAVYFDRFDKVAGVGEARKPIGFREWLQDGDEAFDEQKLDEARKYYSSALQVMDERSLQSEDSVDPVAVERVRSRCVQLGCR